MLLRYRPGKANRHETFNAEPPRVRAVDIMLKSVKRIGLDDMPCRIDGGNDRYGLRLVAQHVSDNRVTGFMVRRGFDLRLTRPFHGLETRAANNAGPYAESSENFVSLAAWPQAPSLSLRRQDHP